MLDSYILFGINADGRHMQVYTETFHQTNVPPRVCLLSIWHNPNNSSGKPEGWVQYLNNSPWLEISSGCFAAPRHIRKCISSFVWAGCYWVISKTGDGLFAAGSGGPSFREILVWSDICHDCWLWPRASAAAASTKGRRRGLQNCVGERKGRRWDRDGGERRRDGRRREKSG